MIGQKYSDYHPVILTYNSNLIEVYNQQEDESKRSQTLLICDKNLEIARNTYGEFSIYTVKWELAAGSNRISLGKI